MLRKNYIYPNRSNRICVSTCALFVTVILSLDFVSNPGFAVTSKITRHNTYDYFSKGETDNVIIDSKGKIKLGLYAETIIEDFTTSPVSTDYKPWSINAIVISPRAMYIGTSPNGGIYKYYMGKLSKIYPVDGQQKPKKQENEEDNDKSNEVDTKEHLTNEHIFAMALDVSGRLLAGISGKECKLLRFEMDKPISIFEPKPEDAKYIFGISVVEDGDIYLATGPEGKIYRLDPLGKNPEIIFDSKDKNILSLAVGRYGFLYAGTDSRGLVYQLDTDTRSTAVLYDSEKDEVTSLLVSRLQDQAYLYAAGTSAEIEKTEVKFAASQPLAGRPEKTNSSGSRTESKGGVNLKIPNTKQDESSGNGNGKKAPPKPPTPSEASFIYQIDTQGYVTDVFSEKVVIFAMSKQGQKLLVGTGNSGALFQIDPATEERAVIYEDKQASQITAVTVEGQEIYAGTANPAKFIKMTGKFAFEGEYTSDLIDAGQPTKWGKLQIESDIPEGCEVLISCRSGNVKDVNDPTFSDWTDPAAVTGPVQMDCPLARFAQYKLILKSQNGESSPIIREVVVANTIPNLKPVVEAVSVDRIGGSGKEGVFKIDYKAKDENDDKLIYTIDFRKLGRTGWIELEEDNEKDSYEWDSKTVEDGRYEIRITSSDERSNTPASALTGSRVSDPVVVDNTGPVIAARQTPQVAENYTLRLQVTDEYSAIDKVEYTVDSHSEWKSTVPMDLVFDTMQEDVDIIIPELEKGEHVVAVKAVDAVGNTTYKSFEITF